MVRDFTPRELDQLRVFRTLAQDVHPYWLELHGFPFRVNIGATVPVAPELIPSDRFHTLAAYVRAAYMPGEDTYFFTISSIVGKKREELRSQLRTLKDYWKKVFEPKMLFQTGEANYRTREIVDTYFNAKMFHRDASRATDLKNIEKFGDMPRMILQFTVLNLAGGILGLDCIVAAALGEEELSPIRESTDGRGRE